MDTEGARQGTVVERGLALSLVALGSNPGSDTPLALITWVGCLTCPVSDASWEMRIMVPSASFFF